MDPMEAIKQTFFQECEEQLAELETGLLAMEGGDGDPETVNAVFARFTPSRGARARSAWAASCGSRMCSRRRWTRSARIAWRPIRMC